MLKVFITVDTEVWPNAEGWPRRPLADDQNCARELACYFYGGEGPSKTGVPYQLEVLRRFGLKGTFFVDPLFSYALGPEPLQELLSLIIGQQQEVGLHLHPEWLTDPRCKNLPEFAGPLLSRYSRRDQTRIIKAGLARLRELGGTDVRSFRAGSWGADETTLEILADLGVTYDSSLNPCFQPSFPLLAEKENHTQPFRLGPLWEFPVPYFVDRPPRGKRPLHVCACSLPELRVVLDTAYAEEWFAVVVVMHSFEFVRVDQLPRGKPVTSQRLLANRFEAFCEYVASRPERFEPCFFSDLDATQIPSPRASAAITSNWGRTSRRYVEQLASRFY